MPEETIESRMAALEKRVADLEKITQAAERASLFVKGTPEHLATLPTDLICEGDAGASGDFADRFDARRRARRGQEVT